MKRNIRTKLLLLTLTFFMMFSCKEKFLNEEPLSFLSPENTFTDAKGLQTALDAALIGIMDQLNGDYNAVSFDNDLSDAAVAGGHNIVYAWINCDVNATPTNGNDNEGCKSRWFYEQCYSNLKNANTVIDYIDNPKWESDEERDHILGSAYFIRAYFYYLQTMHFGNVAFPLNVVTTPKADFRTFTMESIFAQMIVDLEWARDHVKQMNEVARGQVNNSAVRLLLSKYYLLTNQYAKAEQECNNIINSGVHKLVTNADVKPGTTVDIGMGEYGGVTFGGRSVAIPADAVNTLFNDKDGNRLNNKEAVMIFVNAYGLDGSVSKAKSMRAYGPNFGSGFGVGRIKTPAGQNGINDKSRAGEQMMKFGRGQGQMRPTDYSQYEVWLADPNDPALGIDVQDYRHKPGNWFRTEDVVYDNSAAGVWKGKNLRLFSDDGTLLCTDTVRNWYQYPIYKFWILDLDDTKRGDGGHCNLYLYRLAEVYLLRAEARFWQENYQGSADDINVIRNRANAMYHYTSADIQKFGIGAILDERARELYSEEFRSSELTRISIMYATSGKTAYNGKTYNMKDISEDSFWYDRVMEKNSFFKNNVMTVSGVYYKISSHNIFWPVYESIILANTGAVLNQTPGYMGDDRKVPNLIHKVQLAGVPNTDPMLTATEEAE